MYVIPGKEAADTLADRYVVIELDAVRIKGADEVTPIYTVLETEKIFLKLEQIETAIKIHNEMREFYKAKNWDAAETAITWLKTQFNQELNSYYDIILDRINEYKNQELPDDWQGIYEVEPGHVS
jgi:hypothetical protein